MTHTKPAMFFLAALLFVAAASAQQQGMQQPSASQSSSQPQSGAPMSVLSKPGDADPAPPSDAARFADQDFVADALKNNEAQVQMSQLAQKKASYADVQQFSEHMIEIHTKLNEQLAPLAKQFDVSQNQKPSKEQKKEIAQLEQLSGTDFDTAYLQAMAREQQHSLKRFKGLESSSNPNLQKAAKIDEPVLTQHYQILEKIAQTHNVTLDAKE
jgi:putative membrane protein